MNEYTCMKVLLFDPEYTGSLLGKYVSVRPIRFISNLLTTFALCAHFTFFGFEPVDTIWSFVIYLQSVSTWVVFIAYLCTRLLKNDAPSNVYNIVTDIDAQMDKPLYNQKEWKLNLMASIYPLVAGILTTFIYLRGFKPYDLPFLVIIPISYRIMDVALLKYIIATRLRFIRSAEEYMERVEDTVFITRQLLQCNTTLNTTYGLLAACYTAFSCQLALHLFYSIWVIYGVGITINFEPMSHPFLVSGGICSICSATMILAISSSLVVDEVNEISLELDTTYSARECTESQKSLIYIFLMELHHTPVHMSAMGLYGIGRGSVSNACAVLTTYLLVLIQYT